MKTAATVTTCEESLRLLADFWNLRIIEALAGDTLRYCEVQRAVGNVNPATLTKKLLELEKSGLVTRSEEHTAVSYALTSLGKDALPVISAIDAFSKKWN
jgi:DNA-binding HxlR family transcriptional regulator